MCRLFGLMANKPVEIKFSMVEASKSFRQLSSENPHGWGIGGFINQRAVIKKSPIRAIDDPSFDTTVETMNSRCFVAHVRRATVSEPSFDNTHPFGYENWIFAHNGTIRKSLVEKIKTLNPSYQATGSTDSEVYFLWLLKNIHESDTTAIGIQRALKFLMNNGDYEAINFVFANPNEIFAFHHANEKLDEHTLYYVERKEFDLNTYSGETRMFIGHKSNYDEKAVIIASEPITIGEEWKEIDMGELIRVSSKLNIEKWKI